MNQILGTDLALSEIENFFQRLNFPYQEINGEGLLVEVPSYRVDITAEIDLIKEIARLLGYENIPRQLAAYVSSTLADNSLYLLENKIRQNLIGEGLQEFLTCNLIGPSLLEKIPEPKETKKDLISVLNPTSIEQSILRGSLLQGLLQVAKFNYDQGNYHINGFELGKVFF